MSMFNVAIAIATAVVHETDMRGYENAAALAGMHTPSERHPDEPLQIVWAGRMTVSNAIASHRDESNDIA